MKHTILHADVMAGLASMPDESIQCVMTSPPYWGLRDYGIEGQIGLESSPEEYMQKIVAVFREVRRVLRRDGVLWLNLGDCYARSRSAWGLKAKDLVGMPWRIAFALQADGWYLRSDIVWSKPNPMPESVRDRPTRSHEFVFLFAKSPRYFYDHEAIKEPYAESTFKRAKSVNNASARKDNGTAINQRGLTAEQQTKAYSKVTETGGRNRRDVWRIATQATPEAHFATFPEKLVDPCIRAGTSERGCCPECGAPWRRVVEINVLEEKARKDHPSSIVRHGAPLGYGGGVPKSEHITTDWQPSCTCGREETMPCVVLDPFGGSGTVNLVAYGLGRSSVGIELSEKYIGIIKDRWARGGRPAEALEVRAI